MRGEIPGIYKITNKINQKCYIGKSSNIYERWQYHKWYYKTEEKTLYKAFLKYGINNFQFEIIEEIPLDKYEEISNKREKYWIKYYNSYLGFKNSNGYNMTLGGETSSAHILSYEDVENIQQLLLTTRISQTDIGKQFGVSQVTVSQINQGLIWVNEDLIYPLRSKKYKYNYCIDCGAIISKKATRCVKCQSKIRYSTVKPNREELKQLIRTTPFTAIGKQYNVSDNAVRKWCDSYNLPRKSSIIKKYTDEEWKQI